MRIFNEDKTQELTAPDLTAGYLKEDKLLIAHHDAVEGKTDAENAATLQAQGISVEQVNGTWYRVVAEYPNGGKDLKRIYATEAKEAYDETEKIYVYIPYTAEELSVISAKNTIAKAKAYLSKTDYIVLKIAEAQSEGDEETVISLRTEYAQQLEKRKKARAAVNASEQTVMTLEGEHADD